MFGSSTFGSEPFGGDEAASGPMGASTVTGVSITPTSATGSQTFSATVFGTNSPSQSVTWSKVGGGTLTNGAFVAPAQTSNIQAITIRSTSDQDAAYYAEATVTIAATAPAAGLFVTDAWSNDAHAVRAGEAVTGTWYAGGSIGTAGGAATLVSGTLSALGVLSLTGLPSGAGFFLGRSTDGGVFYQAGVVT